MFGVVNIGAYGGVNKSYIYIITTSNKYNLICRVNLEIKVNCLLKYNNYILEKTLFLFNKN